MLDIRRTLTPAGELEVSVAGEIDLGTSPELESGLADALDDALAQGCVQVAIDLSAVEFIDSTGVSVLVRTAQKAELSGASVRVRGAHGIVARVLRVTGVADYLRVSGDPAQDEPA